MSSKLAEGATSVPERPLLKPWYRIVRRDGGFTLLCGR